MFDLARFARLAAAQWVEQRRGWGWFLAIGTLLLALMYLFLATVSGRMAFTRDGQTALFYGALFVSAPVFAGRYFQAMVQPEVGLLTLMRPASAFEKWLLAFLVVAVAYPLAFCVAFEIVNVPAWLLAHAAAVADGAAQGGVDAATPRALRAAGDPERYQLLLPWALGAEETQGRVLATTALLLVGAQGFAVLGSLYFHRMPFIKTILAGVALMISLSMFSAFVGGSPATVFAFWGDDDATRSLGDTVISLLFWFGVPALFWLAGLFALQERELHR